MSNYTFTLPDIGEGIAEAEIVAWHAAVGDLIEEDAPLVDMMTDKATIEITAPVGGRLTALAGAVGDMLAIGAMLAVFEVEGEGHAAPPPAPPPRPAPAKAAPQSSAAPTPPPALSPAAPPPAAATPVPASAPAADSPRITARITASPAVRARAQDLGIDLADVACADGRVRHADLDAYLTYNRQSGYHPASATRPDEEIRVIGLRRRIAENMAASKRHIPHFGYVEEIDVTALEALRHDLNANRGERAKLTMLPLLITAICKTIPAFPMINARYDDEANVVTRHGAVHLGVAAQTDAGLMVPVIRHAETLTIWQLAGEITRLARAARDGKARPDELSGSTLTITSLGPLGGIATMPVINRPEVAIIGPNRVIERPVVRDGQIAIAKLMNLSMACDHRVVDGYDAARYVQALKRLIETPALLFAP